MNRKFLRIQDTLLRKDEIVMVEAEQSKSGTNSRYSDVTYYFVIIFTIKKETEEIKLKFYSKDYKLETERDAEMEKELNGIRWALS